MAVPRIASIGLPSYQIILNGGDIQQPEWTSGRGNRITGHGFFFIGVPTEREGAKPLPPGFEARFDGSLHLPGLLRFVSGVELFAAGVGEFPGRADRVDGSGLIVGEDLPHSAA
jgi:hypothetical protein